ncbi:MAG: hypothetical protein LBH93_00425 [Chitinispirillales bacterium]|jgi:hypothetical protein|nr:hypothetical protein [Chitinispirillales bacterium]
MAKKRYVDIECWDDPWYQDLSPAMKCLWKYICDKCDCAGVWKVNQKLAEFQIGCKFDWAKAENQFAGRTKPISADKWLIVKFIDFQYGTLSPECRPHIPVFKALEEHGLTYPLNLSGLKGMRYPIDTLSANSPKGINTLEEKEDEKENNNLLPEVKIDAPKRAEGALAAKVKPPGFSPPGHLADMWPDYLAVRKAKKAAPTARAFEGIVMGLEKLAPGDYAAQRAILEQSIIGGYTDVYELKAKGGNHGRGGSGGGHSGGNHGRGFDARDAQQGFL